MCCKGAPPVLEFDRDGNLVGHWGGPGAGYEWPDTNHGITVDYKGNVWIGGNDPKDAQILKFTQAGQVPAAGRPSGQERRQPRHGELLARREGHRRSEDERGLRRRRLWQQARRRSSTPTPASSSATGAPTATSRTTPTSVRTIRMRRRRASSAARCTARRSRTTASSTCAIAPTTGSRCSSATARS